MQKALPGPTPKSLPNNKLGFWTSRDNRWTAEGADSMISSHAWSLSHSFATGCVQRLVQVLLSPGKNIHSHNFQQASDYGMNHQGMIEEVSSMTRAYVCTTPLQCFATKKPNKHSTRLVNSKCWLCRKVEEVVSSSRVDLLHATNSRAK
jgi:hypothetical protein